MLKIVRIKLSIFSGELPPINYDRDILCRKRSKVASERSPFNNREFIGIK